MIKIPSGWKLHFLPTVSSTNDEAKKYVQEGHIVQAEEQTAGRGRLGHKWESQKGNLFCSWVILKEGITNSGILSFITALSLGDTFKYHYPNISYSYKWPNDVLVYGKKISGILLEEEGNPPRVIIGMGVNISVLPVVETRYPTTSLKEEGIETTPEEFLSFYLDRFSLNLLELRREGFKQMKSRWESKAEKIGEIIEVRLANRTLIGVFKGLDENGCLILLPEGERENIKIPAGEVFYR